MYKITFKMDIGNCTMLDLLLYNNTLTSSVTFSGYSGGIQESVLYSVVFKATEATMNLVYNVGSANGTISAGSPRYFWLDDVVLEEDVTYSGYRFGFNGMERDNEVKGDGNSYDYGARIYDSRLGRWLSLDPLMKKYPNESNYTFTSDNPILYMDIDGRDKIVSYTIMTDKGTTKFDVTTKDEVMFTYVSKSDGMGGDAGYPTFTDINQSVILDFRTNLKPGENKTFTSEEYAGKELGYAEGLSQKLTGNGGTQISGITFTAEGGGASPTKQKAEKSTELTNIGMLLSTLSAIAPSSNPKVLEAASLLKDVIETVSEVADDLEKNNKKDIKPVDTVCTGGCEGRYHGTYDGTVRNKDKDSIGTVPASPVKK